MSDYPERMPLVRVAMTASGYPIVEREDDDHQVFALVPWWLDDDGLDDEIAALKVQIGHRQAAIEALERVQADRGSGT